MIESLVEQIESRFAEVGRLMTDATVISDRLHVLILLSLSGTVPVELVENSAEKVRIHREQRGVPAVSIGARGLSGAHVASALEDVIQAGPPTTAVKASHESLAQWRDRVRVLSLDL